MSCETRHRAIIAGLLALAGLHGTVDTDTVIRSGIGRRSRRGEQLISEPRSVVLAEDVRTAMGITGHGADTLPAWVPALIALLVRSANTDRRSFLTLQLLTGGWNAVTPHLTDHDRDWLHTADAIGLPLPTAVATRLASLPAAAPLGWALPDPLNRAVERITILDALIGIDAVPPAAVQAVTPRQVLRLDVGVPFASRTDVQTVLRAVLADTPAAAQALRLIPNGIGRVFHLNPITPSVDPRPAAWMEQGIALVLEDAAVTLRFIGGLALDPTALRDPSAEVVAAICSSLATPSSAYHLAPAVAALIQLWRMEGREDTVTATIRRLEPIVAQNPWFSSTIGAAFLAAGVIGPPHGDAVFASIGAVHGWEALAGAAVYAAACRRYGHRPTVAGLDDLVRTRWRTTTSWFAPSPIPLLAVGRERELLLPVIHAERDADRRATMLLDCVDAMAMLAIVGGATRGFLAVLRDAIPSACDPLDPRIVIRLAADRGGQVILAHLPSVPIPPAWTEDTRDHYHRLIPHLVSPAWETAPPPLRTWWTTTLRHVTASSDASVLDRPPPLYPTVAPQAAMVHPTITLAKRAVAHPSWATLPESERRACLTQAFVSASVDDVLTIVARAATPAAVADIQATFPHAKRLHPDTVHALQALIDTDLRRPS